MTNIRWTDGGMAYSGKVLVGITTETIDGKWVWIMAGIERRSGVIMAGKVSSERTARRAVEREWGEWLTLAGLMPA